MREVILNYWNWFADLVNPYHDVINTIVIAAFAVVLARVAWKQTRDARILQRAYLNVKFGGIQSNSAGELVGHVTFQNVGHLPARKLYWLGSGLIKSTIQELLRGRQRRGNFARVC